MAKKYDEPIDETVEQPAGPDKINAIALQDLPAGAPILVKPDHLARLVEIDELWRANAVAPYDVPEGVEFEVEVKA